MSQQGSIAIRIDRAQWHKEGEGGDEHQLPVWACVQWESNNESTELSDWWFPSTDDHSKSSIVDLSSEGVELEYDQRSKGIDLNEDTVTALADSSIQVSIYTGNDHSMETDACLGSEKISLLDLLLHRERQISISFPVESTVSDSEEVVRKGTVSMDVQAKIDMNLSSYVVGMRVLYLKNIAIHQIPPKWQLGSDEDDDNALRTLVDSDVNAATYDLELSLPRANSANETTPVAMKGGKLKYVVEAQTEESTPELENNDQDEEAPQTVLRTGTWQVEFPSNQVARVIFLSHQKPQLVDYITVYKRLPGQLQRRVSSATKITEVVTSAVEFDIQELVKPGIQVFTAKSSLGPLEFRSKESLETELAGATAADEKKKLQAAIAEYTTIVERIQEISQSIEQESTRMEIVLEIVGTPIVPSYPAPLVAPSKSIEALVNVRNLDREREQQWDPKNELRKELRLTIRSLFEKYMECSNDKSEQERRSHLIFQLNSDGSYQQFKEALKYRVIPVIREYMPKISETESVQNDEEEPQSPEQSAHFAELYKVLTEEVNDQIRQVVLGVQETNVSETQSESSLQVFERTLSILCMQALENEVTGHIAKSEWLHIDRTSHAEDLALSCSETDKKTQVFCTEQLVNAWYNYAIFAFTQGDIEKAAANLRRCLSFNPKDTKTLLAFAALLCHQGSKSQAEEMVKQACTHILTTSNATTFKDRVLAHALLGFYYSYFEVDQTGNLTLVELLTARKILRTEGGVAYLSASITSVWIILAEYAQELSLYKIMQAIFKLDEQSRATGDMLSTQESVSELILRANVSIVQLQDVKTAKTYLESASSMDAEHPLVWMGLARIYLHADGESNQLEAAITAYQHAFESRDRLPSKKFKLQLYLQFGMLLMQSTRFQEANSVFAAACEEFSLASCWLGVGISYYRLNQADESLASLAKATRLDATNGEAWGYTALVTLHTFEQQERIAEVETKRLVAKAQYLVDQGLRCGLENPLLLRELGNAFMAIDRFAQAERLLRRSLAAQDSILTRKTLGDVLAAQNSTEEALMEYKSSLKDMTDLQEKRNLLLQCSKLLSTIGRPEEAAEYQIMADDII